MIKFIGTLAFLFFVFCVVMLFASLVKRRVNTRLWLIGLAASLAILIIFYYIDVFGGAAKTAAMFCFA